MKSDLGKEQAPNALKNGEGKLDFVAEGILREWERAGGLYAVAAKMVRADLEKEQ